ncbi:MAG: TldD/PmbA family protein [Candidatus Bathyarchaeia archaeon]
MQDALESILDYGLTLGVEFVDVRVQDTIGTTIRAVDGKTKQLINSHNKGAGIRAFSKGAWGFSSTNNLGKKSLKNATKQAVKMARAAEKKVKTRFELKLPKPVVDFVKISAKKKLMETPVDEKVEYVLALDKSARERNEVVNTNELYMDSSGSLIVSNSNGTYVETNINYVFATAYVFAQEGSVKQQGYEPEAGAGGFEIVETEHAQKLGEISADKAIRLLKAKSAPAGKFSAVLDPRLAGIFIHEAFGHACEADGVLAGMSILEGKINEKVGSEIVTVIDDPTLKGKFGYFPYDSEGTPARRKVLVKNGILRGFMHNLETSSRMGVEPNGSARAETYQHIPVVRMSNTYIEKGDYTFEEMIEDIDEGIYAKGSIYGYVDPAKGQFMFKPEEAYMIERGELTSLLREAAISGLILEVLKNTEAVGKDFQMMDPGFCGKSLQSARVDDGGPHIKVREVVFGGM